MSNKTAYLEEIYCLIDKMSKDLVSITPMELNRINLMFSRLTVPEAPEKPMPKKSKAKSGQKVTW
ncbi:MAG: hypothetical protein Solivirus2_19 [Solivirus sp.]|uniref:Uncharacterized protein n=1 Tax=Solivirus sp. TaxID=2487772 RepID=A0A3G5AFN5_9VIRU|nr:MAG: hypothetical protein Solivirus2_19 [Solivirus sp.]